MYPAAIFLVVVSFLFAKIIGFDLYTNILVLLNVHGTALSVNLKECHFYTFWYVSSMLWVLGIYYYLIKNYGKKISNLVIFLTVFFCYSFLIVAKEGKINTPSLTFYYVFNVGFMRALGGIGIGYFIGEWWNNNSERIRNIQIKTYQKILITFVEGICVYFMVKYLMFRPIRFKNDMIFIFDFVAVIMLFLARKGYISQVLDDTIIGNICKFFSKYTYSIYLSHKLLFDILEGTVWKTHSQFVYTYPFINAVCTLGCAFFCGVLIYHFVEKPSITYLSKRKTILEK